MCCAVQLDEAKAAAGKVPAGLKLFKKALTATTAIIPSTTSTIDEADAVVIITTPAKKVSAGT
jgi:hypothetical protein